MREWVTKITDPNEVKIEELEAELKAQEVSKHTYIAEWRERARRQQETIDHLRLENIELRASFKVLTGVDWGST